MAVKSCQYGPVFIKPANTGHLTRIGISYLHLHDPEVANTRFQYESYNVYWQFLHHRHGEHAVAMLLLVYIGS